MYNYEPLLICYSNVSTVFWRIIYIKNIADDQHECNYAFHTDTCSTIPLRKFLAVVHFLTVPPSPEAPEDKAEEPQGQTKPPGLVPHLPALGPVTLTLPYKAPGWLQLISSPFYLQGAASGLGIHGSSTTSALPPHIYLVSIFETRFHVSCRCPITHRDLTLQVGSHVPAQLQWQIGKRLSNGGKFHLLRTVSNMGQFSAVKP